MGICFAHGPGLLVRGCNTHTSQNCLHVQTRFCSTALLIINNYNVITNNNEMNNSRRYSLECYTDFRTRTDKIRC